MKQWPLRAIAAAASVGLLTLLYFLLPGCSSPNGPAPATSMVRMSVVFTNAGTPALMKVSAGSLVDSLRIDSAVVVFSRLRFFSHVDTVHVDSGEVRGDDDDHDSSVVFRGPFVVHLHDTVAITFAGKLLPPGNYDGIAFKIHRLGLGERHEDADEHEHGVVFADSTLPAGSIVVWGAVHSDTTWKSFTFVLNDELAFKVRGNFTVPAWTGSVNIALSVDMGSWFRSPVDGSALDPTDTTEANRWLIRQAIAKAFGACRGGHDRGDGHPD